MPNLESHLDVLNLWPTAEALAKDLPGEVGGGTVRHWRRTGHIPPNRFDDVLSAAQKRGFEGVTYPLLAAGARA